MENSLIDSLLGIRSESIVEWIVGGVVALGAIAFLLFKF